jgi:hypothetical protein
LRRSTRCSSAREFSNRAGPIALDRAGPHGQRRPLAFVLTVGRRLADGWRAGAMFTR